MATEKVLVTKTKLDDLANVVAAKTKTDVLLTIDEMRLAVASLIDGNPLAYGTAPDSIGTATIGTATVF